MKEELMARFEPGQLIVEAPERLARARELRHPLLVLSAAINEDKESWTVEFLRRGEVVKATMCPANWTTL